MFGLGLFSELAPSAALVRLAHSSFDLYFSKAVPTSVAQSLKAPQSILGSSNVHAVESQSASTSEIHVPHQLSRGYCTGRILSSQATPSRVSAFDLHKPRHPRAGSGLDGNFYSLQQLREYKSNKRSLKAMNTAASWKAAAPFLPPVLPNTGTELHPKGFESAPILDTCIPPIPEVPKPPEVTPVGSITGQYELALQQHFAVIELCGKQFKVTPDDILFVDQLRDVHVNQVLSLQRVMMLGNQSRTIIGRPYIPEASALVAVEEHFKNGKVHVFKMKRRKRYRRYKGPRAELMTLRVLRIEGIEPSKTVDNKIAKNNDNLPIRWFNISDKVPELEGEEGEEEEEEEEAEAGVATRA